MAPEHRSAERLWQPATAVILVLGSQVPGNHRRPGARRGNDLVVKNNK